MARKKKTNKTKPIDSLKHKDKRANIPTEELPYFVKEDENRPETVLYPIDPSIHLTRSGIMVSFFLNFFVFDRICQNRVLG